MCERIPYLILPVRQLSREPFGSRRCTENIRRSADMLKRYERAIGQAAGPVSIRTIRRSAASEPSGSTPGPSRPKDPPK